MKRVRVLLTSRWTKTVDINYVSYSCVLTFVIDTQGIKGNWQGQIIFKRVFKLDTENRTYLIALNSCKTMFKKCNIAFPKENKANISRSTSVNRVDDRGPLSVKNDQMPSHEIKDRKTQNYMRLDPDQVKHVCSGHYWNPQFQ